MQPPARRSSQQGLLLFEAVLSAVVIAVGLVFISRGLSSQLHAIRTVEEIDGRLALARRRLLELEGERLFDLPQELELTGAFEAPDEELQWTLAAELRADVTDPEGEPLASEVTLTVAHEQSPSTTVTLSTAWPREWIPE